MCRWLPRPSLEAPMSHSHPVSAHAPGARAGTSPSETGVGIVTGLSRKVAHCLLSSALIGLALPCRALPGGREPSLFAIDFSVVAPPLFITHRLSAMLWPSWK